MGTEDARKSHAFAPSLSMSFGTLSPTRCSGTHILDALRKWEVWTRRCRVVSRANSRMAAGGMPGHSAVKEAGTVLPGGATPGRGHAAFLVTLPASRRDHSGKAASHGGSSHSERAPTTPARPEKDAGAPWRYRSQSQLVAGSDRCFLPIQESSRTFPSLAQMELFACTAVLVIPTRNLRRNRSAHGSV